MTTSKQPDPKLDPGAPGVKGTPPARSPGTADKPAGQPALKGPLEKPRTS